VNLNTRIVLITALRATAEMAMMHHPPGGPTYELVLAEAAVEGLLATIDSDV
jgi:hypothetical protein